MALSFDEQQLYNFGRDALPSWLKADDEFLAAAAKQFGSVLAFIKYLYSQALIETAQGATATTPDWLQQHARDRGTSRQAGESTPALRQRLRQIPDAITRAALLDAANAALAADGVVGSAALVELPRDAAYTGVYAALTGTGGTFAQNGTVTTFTPTALPWPTPPFQDPTVTPIRSWRLVITGAASAGNNGTRAITGLAGNGALVTNAAGVAGADPTVTWKAQRLDVAGNLTDGFHHFYAKRGWRSSSARPFTLIMILPFGTGVGTANSVIEALRLKKAAGVRVIVERRLNP